MTPEWPYRTEPRVAHRIVVTSWRQRSAEWLGASAWLPKHEGPRTDLGDMRCRARAYFTPWMVNTGMRIVPRLIALVTLGAVSWATQGCASLQNRDPVNVTVAGIESLENQGFELRMLVRLRVQNPNDAPLDYNGVAVEMNVQGKTFATGVSDVVGSVPRFGESLISVPVTVSAFRILGQAVDVIRSDGSGPISYEMKGKLNASGFNSTHFRIRGQFQVPATGTPATPN